MSRVQQAVLKQLARQIRHQTRRENEMFHMNLRHRIQQHNLVQEHFADREHDALQKFESYFKRIQDAIQINKTRFDLSVDERIDAIFQNHHRPVPLLAFDQAEFQETSDRMFKASNDTLFFKNLYSSTGGNPGKPSNNDDFYTLIIVFSIVITEILKILH